MTTRPMPRGWKKQATVHLARRIFVNGYADTYCTDIRRSWTRDSCKVTCGNYKRTYAYAQIVSSI